MFNSGSIAGAVFEHPLNEFKSVQCTRIVHDFYDSDPKRGQSVLAPAISETGQPVRRCNSTR